MSNSRQYRLKSAFLATSMLTLGSASVAYAQDTSSETVVVTGTRLSTEGFVAPTPVTSLGSAQISDRAPGDIADVVDQIPTFRSTITNTQNQKGSINAQNQLDLRGLGTNRTLVLLDGNRFVPTNLDSSVDINSIPVLLLDRVDVVTGGASAAYGSDAVAGVVNFVMKDKMDGIIGNVGAGTSQQGDNTELDYNIAGGINFFNDRFHMVGSLEYTNNQGVGNPESRPEQYGNQQSCLVNPTAAQRAAGNLPAETYVNNCTNSQDAASTLVTGGLTAAGNKSTAISNITFGPGGTVLPFNVGTVAGTLMYGGAPNPTDATANLSGNFMIEFPHKRLNLYDKATFDITNDISAWAQFLWSDNQTTSSTAFPEVLNTIIPITGAYANPYVPAALQTAAINAGLTALTVGRIEESVGGQDGNFSDITSRLAFGLKGKVFGDWSWDVSYTHGESPYRSRIGNLQLGNYLESTFAVAGPNGTAVCGPVAANPNFATGAVGAGRGSQVASGCQPYNIFGPTIDTYNSLVTTRCVACAGVSPALINSPSGSEAAVNYIWHESYSGTYYQQDDFAANLRGSPFSTWAGSALLAVGFEHRREGGSQYDDFQAQNLYGYPINAGAPYSGSFFTNEGYFELNTPLLKNEFLAEEADVDISFRETGYSLYGTLPTYKVGLNWQINDDVRIRANRSRDVREPAIKDLFAAAGLSPTLSFENPINNTTGIEFAATGGNANLKPENAASTTVGVVYTPTDGWFVGLNASVDWFQVNIENVITTFTPGQIATQCANGVTYYCTLVSETGGPGGSLLIQDLPINLDVKKTSGMDFDFSYSTALDSIDLPGQLTARWLTTYTDYNIVVGLTTLEQAGASQGEPKWVSNINFNYALGPSATNIQIRYSGAFLGDANLIGPGQEGYSPTLSNSVNINQFPSSYYIDLSENYDLYDVDGLKFTGFLNINNILDKQPPGGETSYVAFLYTGGDPYDLIGRTFKVGLRFKY